MVLHMGVVEPPLYNTSEEVPLCVTSKLTSAFHARSDQ